MINDIHEYIIQEETSYKQPVPIIDDWEWNMKEHIRLTTLYKNSQFSEGNSADERDDKPFKNIIKPILNLQYRAQGFDVKDIELYIDDSESYYKSFLVKKFHEKWAREEKLDTFIDEMVETYVDYGGVLVKNSNKVRPEVVPWQSVAFCDQTDVLSGPIGIKHFFSPDQLKDMEEVGWGKKKNGADTTIAEVIELSESHKVKDSKDGRQSETPGKYIEVYEIHGTLPKNLLDDEVSIEEKEYVSQLQIVCFYQSETGKHGLTLFKGEEKESPFKLLLRDEIYGRALGFGGAEELFEPQIWVNYDMIRMKEMLDGASKTLHITDDPAFFNRNRSLNAVENNEVLVVDEGRTVKQMDMTPRNINLFDRSVAEWESHAQQMGAANDAIMGKSPVSGTPFKLQELVTSEAHSLHEYRKGKLATFLDEIYMDWIIPYITREITKGKEFLSELTLDEMQYVADKVLIAQTNDLVKRIILNGQLVTPEVIEQFKAQAKIDFMKDKRKFIKILKDEMKDAPVSVKTNIAGKQKDLAGVVDKLVNVFKQIVATPQILQSPPMAKLFNQIIEGSGLEPVDFSNFTIEVPGKPVNQNTVEAPAPSPAPGGAPGATATLGGPPLT